MKLESKFDIKNKKYYLFLTNYIIIMAVIVFCINNIFIISSHYNNCTVCIYKYLIINILALIVMISTLILSNRNENKDAASWICLNFFLVSTLPILSYPKYQILLFLPYLSMINSSILNKKRINIISYVLCIFIMIYIFHTDILKISNALTIVINIFIITTILIMCKKLRTKLEYDSMYINNLQNELRIEPLTKLLNKNALYNDLHEVKKTITKKDELPGLIILDLDHFKRINDTYGHINGDKALKTLTRTIRRNMKDNMNAYRFGGEEFIILIKDYDPKRIHETVEKIKREFTKIQHKYLNNESITFSAGVALYDNKVGVDEWIENADKALYEAKETGRNKIVTYK